MNKEETGSREEQLFAFDLPSSQSPAAAVRMIEELCPEGFYPWQLLPLPDAGVRVFCKRLKADPQKVAAARVKASEVTKQAKDLEDVQAEKSLVAILATNPRITVGTARVKLGRIGFRRGADWVREAMERARRS